MTDRGCFALPSVFSHTSSTCGSCEARAACGEKVVVTLQRISHAIKVDDLIAQFHTGRVESVRSLTFAQRTAVASMPGRLGARLENLFKQGFDQVAKSRFAQGDNPFNASGAKHLHLAGQLLLAGGFTKLELRTECIERFGWTEGTAFSQVSQALALLRGLGLTSDADARIQLRD